MHELPHTLPDLLTSGEVAQVFGVHSKTAWRWAKAGRISSVRTPGGHRRFSKAEIQAVLSGGYTPAEQATAVPE